MDQVRAWGLPNRMVVADAGYGDTTEFRAELEARHLPYVVGVSATTGGVEETTRSEDSTLCGPRCTGRTLPVRKAAAGLRAGRHSSREGLEDNSVAARHEGMAGIAIPGPARPALPRLRAGPATAQGSLVAERMAGVGKGTHEVLPG